MPVAVNVFAAYQAKAWPIHFRGRLRFRDLVLGGTPTDEKVAKAWIGGKFADNDDMIRRLVAETMAARQVDAKKAIEIVGDLKLLKGFKLDKTGRFLDARCLKANVKEGASVAAAVGHVDTGKKYGLNRAGLRSFVAEHIMVEENKLHLLVDGKPAREPHGIQQRFVHTYNGNGITYEEYVNEAEIAFTVKTDWDFGDEFWAMVWLKAGEQGLGATRSQGFGRFDVIAWDRVSLSAPRQRARQKVAA